MMRWVPILALCGVMTGAGGVAYVAITREEIYLVSPLMRLVHLQLPLALAAFCAIGIAVRAWRAMVASIVIAAGFGVAFAEVFLAMFPAPSTLESRALLMAEGSQRRATQADQRSLRDVVRALRQSGTDAYPTFSPTQFILNVDRDWRPPLEIDGKAVLPLTNVARTRSVYCNESGRWLVFDSDRHGFNNPDSVWDQPTTRIAIVGDSFAQGACVQPDEAPAALLRAREPTVLTVGVGGTGPLLQLAILKEYLVERAPDVVFWFFYEGNDLHVNLSLERLSTYLKAYLEPGHRHRLVDSAARIDAFLRSTIDSNFDRVEAERLARAPQGFSLRRSAALLTLRERLGLLECPRRDQDFSLLRAIAAEGRRAVEAWGGRLVMVYLPIDPRGACDLFGVEARTGNWLYDGVLGAFEAAGTPVVDLRARYVAQGSPAAYHYYPGSHFSAEGYRFVVDHLQRWIAENPPAANRAAVQPPR